MNFLVIGHVQHSFRNNQYFGYGPYVKEINIWGKYANTLTVISPIDWKSAPDPIDLPYNQSNINFISIPGLNLIGLRNKLRSLLFAPYVFFKIFIEMRNADHIHLRCPGNIGLLGCVAQIFFPNKKKTAKYAGNWDRSANKPWSYLIQQHILMNTFWTKNMQTLVYGDWESNNPNLKSFFTASYSEKEKIQIQARSFSKHDPIKLMFVGTLNGGKNPILSAEVGKILHELGVNSQLHFYGEGKERKQIEEFIAVNKLEKNIFLHGNIPAPSLKEAYQNSHFLVFISDSEGWPKAVAEAMFWGCLPLTKAVSCVPQMLDFGKRGDLVDSNPQKIAEKIIYYINHHSEYIEKVNLAMEWSRNYTLEIFEEEIKKLVGFS